MKEPHLLRVAEGPESFAPVFRAAAALGLHVGWLDFPREPVPAPHDLTAAAALGARRAVSAGEGGSITVKPRRGAPVLKDLLREHFLGCALVLIAGEGPLPPEIPRLSGAGGEWRIESGGEPRRFTAEALAAALRSPKAL